MASAGGLAVIGRERDVALAIAKRRDSSDIALAALFLFAAHRLGRLAKRGAGKTRLALVDQRPRPRKRLLDDGVDNLSRSAPGDLRFINLDRVLNSCFLPSRSRFRRRRPLAPFPG